ncbi:MAG: adenosylhomocysteinase [Aigarchaeota archaeon]|nr:adenosylhomocysteinase [Aigarchaeota archaeon]MDW8092466.1 adenosylhomocysteinase [Nitrososphaerota archaeon]
MERGSNYWVEDLRLAPSGRERISWAERHMPVCMRIRKRFESERPLEGIKVSMCVHVTKETAVLARTLSAGGARVSVSASNPSSTQNEVASALVEDGISVYAFRGQDVQQYYQCIVLSLSQGPDVTVDDGADMTILVHKLRHSIDGEEVRIARGVLSEISNSLSRIVGGTEETTTGVIRLRSLRRDGLLLYPVIAVNDTPTKRLFDNPIGTGQSAIDGLLRATNVLLAGKRVVVVGYGQVGSGIAARARGLGANVIVVEVDPVRALMAAMNGYEVTTMSEASKVGDVFITATGNTSVIRGEHMNSMKDGALLANAGHYDVEISKGDLEALAVEVRNVSPLVTEYKLKSGRSLYLLAGGRLVNLVAAEGHPSEVMDLSFALQALSVEYIVKNSGRLPVDVLDVPSQIDRSVAMEKLKSIGIGLEEMTDEQRRYYSEWRYGT